MEQLQNKPIIFISAYDNTTVSMAGHTESWIDLISMETKYTIAFSFECITLCYGLCVVLAPNWYRRQLRFKTGWNETEDKIPMAVYNWYTQRSALAIVAHSLCWLLYESVGLKPDVVYALTGIPFGIISIHSLLNDIPKECNVSSRADIQMFIMASTKLFLLCINSPNLKLAEQMCNIMTITAGLQLYLTPSLVSWFYKMPCHYPKTRVVSHHMKFYGLTLLVMSILVSALVWQDDREMIIFALAASLLFSVVGYALMIEDARIILSSMPHIFYCCLIVLAVGTTLMIL